MPNNNTSSRTTPHARQPMNVNDVEKRWNDPLLVRRAASYCAGVAVIAAIAAGIYLATDQTLWAWAIPIIFLVGGLGGLVQAYRVWRRGGRWPIWQGAGWVLFALMLATLALPVAR